MTNCLTKYEPKQAAARADGLQLSAVLRSDPRIPPDSGVIRAGRLAVFRRAPSAPLRANRALDIQHPSSSSQGDSYHAE